MTLLLFVSITLTLAPTAHASNVISGFVYYELGGGALYDAGIDQPITGATASTVCNGSAFNTTTTVNGNFNLGQMPVGTCTLTIRLQDGQTATYSKTFAPNGGCAGTPNTCGNLTPTKGFVPLATPTPIPTATPTPTPMPTPTPLPVTYTITGTIFNDTNKDGIKQASEAVYVGTPSITASRGTVTTAANGSYTISNLTAGTVTISYTSLPSGYNMTYPLNGPPSSFQVTVGPGCSTNAAKNASCL